MKLNKLSVYSSIKTLGWHRVIDSHILLVMVLAELFTLYLRNYSPVQICSNNSLACPLLVNKSEINQARMKVVSASKKVCKI